MKQSKVILAVLTALSLITACQPVSQLSPKSPLLQSEGTFTNSTQRSKTTIEGKVEFSTNSPLLLPSLGKRGDGGAFSSKATITEIATDATVSLIYPHTHPSYPNKTIATGLTNSSGQFIINPSNIFAPQTGDVFILEASKRIGTTGNDVMTVRTFIQWNGNSWDSITTPGIYINATTTALTVISTLNPAFVTSAGTINKLPVVNGITQLQDINSSVTGGMIANVKDFVTSLLSNNRDPIHYIKYDSNSAMFSISNPVSLKTISTVAGGSVEDGGQATNAYLSEPGVAVDSSGNLFIADTYNNRIRKVSN